MKVRRLYACGMFPKKDVMFDKITTRLSITLAPQILIIRYVVSYNRYKVHLQLYLYSWLVLLEYIDKSIVELYDVFFDVHVLGNNVYSQYIQLKHINLKSYTNYVFMGFWDFFAKYISIQQSVYSGCCCINHWSTPLYETYKDWGVYSGKSFV